MGTVPKGDAHVEQCPACQGVFLDRSQLDRFLAAEAAFYAGPSRRRLPHIPSPRRAGGKRSFVEELFE
jgi:Zn-finger nucleic acid-binding protein